MSFSVVLMFCSLQWKIFRTLQSVDQIVHEPLASRAYHEIPNTILLLHLPLKHTHFCDNLCNLYLIIKDVRFPWLVRPSMVGSSVCTVNNKGRKVSVVGSSVYGWFVRLYCFRHFSVHRPHEPGPLTIRLLAPVPYRASQRSRDQSETELTRLSQGGSVPRRH
jgi:hypothetical protein